MRLRVLLIGVVLGAGAGVGGKADARDISELSVQYAVKADQSPVLDGKLDEPCWQAAPAFTRYRELYGSHFQPSSLRLVWDDKGLYMGIVNHEERLDRMKVSVRTRDGGMLWVDDSVEIFLDPTCTGSSMYKLGVNSVGAIEDIWQVDAGFVDTTWSASSARAAVGRAADAWTIEFFVSWADLKKTPRSGDVWMMMQVRFSWTGDDGKICGVSTSGGHWYKRQFGYLYFTDSETPSAAQLGGTLLGIVASQPWVLPVDGSWLYADQDNVEHLVADAIVKRLRDRAQKAIAGVATSLQDSPDDTLGKKLAALQERFRGTEGPPDAEAAFAVMKELNSLADEAAVLRDEVMLAELLGGQTQE